MAAVLNGSGCKKSTGGGSAVVALAAVLNGSAEDNQPEVAVVVGAWR